jgi:hypothetical protein
MRKPETKIAYQLKYWRGSRRFLAPDVMNLWLNNSDIPIIITPWVGAPACMFDSAYLRTIPGEGPRVVLVYAWPRTVKS